MLRKAREEVERAQEIRRERDQQVQERQKIKMAQALADKKQLMEIREHWLMNDKRAEEEKLKISQVSSVNNRILNRVNLGP